MNTTAQKICGRFHYWLQVWIFRWGHLFITEDFSTQIHLQDINQIIRTKLPANYLYNSVVGFNAMQLRSNCNIFLFFYSRKITSQIRITTNASGRLRGVASYAKTKTDWLATYRLSNLSLNSLHIALNLCSNNLPQNQWMFVSVW